MLLTNEERNKFVAYLLANINSDRGIIAELEKMGGPMIEVAKRRKAEMAARIFVMNDLANLELETIGETNDNNTGPTGN